eukprot:TRINITY_DN14951_c1_g4_i1.p1 TRINITY_DN14951_c1_g4~~TRINITY_DN14951_c1_g4_i1.p1  ORF type:complete len:568 (+),score=47.34 TRINITY_DN14951_c1_g4_i1:45-1706(+)
MHVVPPPRRYGGPPEGYNIPPPPPRNPHWEYGEASSWSSHAATTDYQKTSDPWGAHPPKYGGPPSGKVVSPPGAYGAASLSWKRDDQRYSPYDSAPCTTPKSSVATPPEYRQLAGTRAAPVDASVTAGKDSFPAEAVRSQQHEDKQASKQKPEAPAASTDAKAEPSRDAQPLQLMKERAPELAWETIIDDPGLRSWSFVAHEPAITQDDFAMLRDKINWLELKSGWGDTTKLTRKVMWFTRPGCTCPYEYGSESCPAVNFPSWFDAMTERWLGKLKLQNSAFGMPNCANINLYDGGEQAVSWHADDEPLFKGKTQDALIISVSLGAARKFQVGLRAPRKGAYLAPEKGTIESYWLEHGHIATMEGLFQKHYLHQVAKAGVSTEPRINVTFRYNVAHVAPCALAPPSAKDKAAVWLTLPAAASFLQRGFPKWAPALNHCPELQNSGLIGSSSMILDDILGWGSGEVELVDDADWTQFPEIGAAYQEVGGEEVSLCVAMHKKRNIWAVGFVGKGKVRTSTARLALCIALLHATEDVARIVNKYPGLAKLMDESRS